MEYCRKINIIGDIDETAYREFVEALDGMLEIDSETPVWIELLSHGGDAMVALAFYDRIRQIPGKVTINAKGIVASAAVLVFAAGDERVMGKNAWAMVHEDVVAVDEDARVSAVENAARTSRMLENQWNKLLAERSKVQASVWEDVHKKELHISAATCLKLGLATKVI